MACLLKKGKNMEENTFLETEKIGTLMKKYSVPCIISLLVGALYNIVDQIFIANASYLGSYGNAANTVVFPLTVIALAIAVMIGDGCCAFVSLNLGRKRPERARKSVGNSIVMAGVSGLLLCMLYLALSDLIIAIFGGTVNAETFRHAKEYFFYITLGIPFKTPVDGKIPVRRVISREQADALIDRILSIQAKPINNSNVRELSESYRSSILTQECQELLELIMSIYAKKHTIQKAKKKLSSTDASYFKEGEKLLFGELAVALGIPYSEVQSYIRDRVNTIQKGKVTE